MKKINLLFVIPQLERGGSESLVYNIASLLDKNLFNVSVAYFKYYGNEGFREAFLQQNIRLYQIDNLNGSPLSNMLDMSKIVKRCEIDVVNAHHFVSMVNSFYSCKIANRCRLIYTEHSSWEVERVSFKWRAMGMLLLRYLDCVMGISDDVAESIKTKYYLNGKNVLTVRNGVELGYRRNTDNIESIKKEFGLNDNTKVVVTVANFRKVKNHILLLNAFSELIKELRNVKLMLIGQGHITDSDNSENEIKQYIRDNNLYDKVVLTGYRKDVKDFLALADLFCLTSFEEGLPISMLEAMSVGLPVVGTNVPGIRDVIIEGRNGHIVELGDYMELKDALLKILTNEKIRSMYGGESKRMVKDLYSMEQCVQHYQDLFLGLSKH